MIVSNAKLLLQKTLFQRMNFEAYVAKFILICFLFSKESTPGNMETTVTWTLTKNALCT